MIGNESMDELHQAWSELDRLEQEEMTAVKRLLHIRVTIKACRTKIDVLLKKRPPAIDRLPPELLSLIFKHSIPDFDNPGEWMQKLSGVSRIWQDVILNTPTLWNTIIVAEDVGLANLQIQLKRSRQTLLHISIRGWQGYFPLSGDLFRELLEAILPTTDRWNTLSFY